MTAGREPVPAVHSGPAGAAPAWLRELAAAATTMEISPLLVPPATGGRESAVLILFGDGPGGPDLLFIQRSEGLRLHAGQPAFPGGAIDAGDGGPVGAALRTIFSATATRALQQFDGSNRATRPARSPGPVQTGSLGTL